MEHVAVFGLTRADRPFLVEVEPQDPYCDGRIPVRKKWSDGIEYVEEMTNADFDKLMTAVRAGQTVFDKEVR